MATEQEIIIKIGAQDNASATMQQINEELQGVTQQLADLEKQGKGTGKGKGSMRNLSVIRCLSLVIL